MKHTSGKLFCVSANKPLPAGLDTFYFEVTLKKLGGIDNQPSVALVGLAFNIFKCKRILANLPGLLHHWWKGDIIPRVGPSAERSFSKVMGISW